MTKIVLRFGVMLALCAWSPSPWQPLWGQSPRAGVEPVHNQKQQSTLTGTQAQNDQGGSKTSPLIVDVVNHPKSDPETAEEKNDDRKAIVDGWTVGAAIAVALFTGLLVIIGWYGVSVALGSLRAIERQGNDTRNALILTQRPKLIVRNVVIWPPSESGVPLFGKGRPVHGQFYVANVGGSNATVSESHCMVIGLQATLPMERPYEGKNGNNPITVKAVLPPGGVEVALFSDDNPFPDFDPTPFVVVGNQSANRVYLAGVYVMGWIEYSDDLGFIRNTAFCRKYDPDRRRFFAVDDPDYEHAE